MSSGPAFSSIDTFCSCCCSWSLSRCIPQKLAYKSKGNLWNKSLVKIHKHKNSMFSKKRFPWVWELNKIINWNKAGRLRPFMYEKQIVQHKMVMWLIIPCLTCICKEIWQRIPNTLWIPFLHELIPPNYIRSVDKLINKINWKDVTISEQCAIAQRDFPNTYDDIGSNAKGRLLRARWK